MRAWSIQNLLDWRRVMSMSGSGGRSGDSFARMEWRRYQVSRLREIAIHRARGWGAFTLGIILTLVFGLSLVLILGLLSTTSSSESTMSIGIGLLLVVCANGAPYFFWKSWQAFHLKKKLKMELDEHLTRAKQCESKGGWYGLMW